MSVFKTILGALIASVLFLAVVRFIPWNPDLSDWGGRAFPRSYLEPLIILAILSYLMGWTAGKISPVTGRLSAMLAGIISGGLIVAFDIGSNLLRPLFHHPAYPVFSDQALLALAVLLTAAHLGGLRCEKNAVQKSVGKAETISVAPNSGS
ncbi:MAG: hypothetical protein ABIC40_00770 [bacterium]